MLHTPYFSPELFAPWVATGPTEESAFAAGNYPGAATCCRLRDEGREARVADSCAAHCCGFLL